MLETNKHPRGVCNIDWGKGGRITDEKGVFIQTQNIIASLKALVSVKCLNTFVHDLPLKTLLELINNSNPHPYMYLKMRMTITITR